MPDRIESEIEARERTHWRGKPALISVVAFFATLVLLLVICGALTGWWTGGKFPAQGPDRGATADPAWDKGPPQLQTHPDVDLAVVRKEEYQNLHTVRWTDAGHTYATIPIEDAMSMLAQAAAAGQTGQLLPAPKSATPVDLQVQKSGALAPPVQSSPKP